jgi:hypothetical protein
MDKREISEEFAEIGARVIQEEESLVDIRNSLATIVYLTSEQRKMSKGKKVCAQCERVPDKYKWSIPADYTITVFLPNIEGFSEEQKRILIFHELLHIDIDFDQDGNDIYSVKPHDYEDFKEIIDRFGTDWSVVDEG